MTRPARAPAKRIRGLYLTAAFALGLCASCSDSTPRSERPTVVLIVFDALSAGRVSHLGYTRETTPNLDAIAAEGLSFTNCMTPAPYTLASIPSLLTGRRPDTHGVVDSSMRLAEAEATLAERLAQAGYRTIAGVSQPNGGSSFGNAQGFEEFHELWTMEPGALADYTHERTNQGFMIPGADQLVELTERTLSSDDERPLFLYLHVLEPHQPYQAPAEFAQRWTDPDYEGALLSEPHPELFYDIVGGRYVATRADIEQVSALYDSNLAWADHNLGRIRAALVEAGLWDDALVLITSDHGEACWEHEQWGHNWELYEEFVRVPLTLKLPGDEGARDVLIDELVSTMDVLPTICESLDLPLGAGLGLDGRSLLRLALDPACGDGARELYLRTSHAPVPHLALRTQSTKTIVRIARNRRIDSWERYRIESDPLELLDEASLEDEDARQVAQRLRAWYAETLQTRAGNTRNASNRDDEMLEALGYAGDEESD